MVQVINTVWDGEWGEVVYPGSCILGSCSGLTPRLSVSERRQGHAQDLTWRLQVAACHLGAQPDGPDAQHASVPYVLIQGPPGTGKTHTVKVACFLQYYG